MRRFSRLTVAAVAATTVSGFVLTGTASAAAGRTDLPGSVPPWAASSNFKSTTAGSDTVGFRVYLGWRNSAQAEALAAAVSTPGNAQYGKYLTPQQFRQQFAPSQSDVTAVQQWLRNAGFTVDYTPANNHYVAAEGTVDQANTAFGTTLGEYSYQGLTLRAPESTLSVPAGLPAISGVVGLDESDALLHTDHVVADSPPSAGFRNAQPMSAYFGEKRISTADTPDGTKLPTSPDYSFAPKGYTPPQIRGAYGLSESPTAGQGVTVAIIDAFASPTIYDDASLYADTQDPGHPLSKTQFSQVVAPGVYKHPETRKWDPSGWYGEETLDVEAVHATAPGANIVFVGSANNGQDMDAALNHVVDQKLATIVTNSYGWNTEALPFGFIKPQYDTTVQAAAEGIGVYFSSGDDSDQTAGNPANASAATPDWPASDPWVTAVGGTSLAYAATGNDPSAYTFENAWATGKSTLNKATKPSWNPPTYLYGSGGGTSRLFTQPYYQAGVVPSDIALGKNSGGRSQAMRSVPDVAALGDPNTGMLVGQTQTFSDGVAFDYYRIGGTSLASPLFAGMMAVAESQASQPIGFANPKLYSLYSKTGSPQYRDVTAPTQAAKDTAVVRSDFVNGENDQNGYKYSLRRFGFDSGLTIKARSGYDDITGVGTPNGAAFLSAIAH